MGGFAGAPSALAAPTLGGRVLRQGMSGPDVTTLQHLLTEAGFPTKASGTFGPWTRSHVIGFQTELHLLANGVVTRSVAAALRSTVANMASTTAPTGGVAAFGTSIAAPYSPLLKLGSIGKWVTLLQKDLTFAGYSTPITGYFGSQTLQAIDSFKQANNLALNASFGKKAWNVLRAAVSAVEGSVPTGKARVNPDGTATAPANAPAVIKAVIAAANQIATRPYCYGGGHGSFKASCYDCSGSVSYALHAAGLLSVPEDSSEMESYGLPGYGRWITIFANPGHAYMEIAGVWFDTAAQRSSNGWDRWSPTHVSSLSGFVVRHFAGL
jgi:peptidoglycan hydrolase-like protein with peptidoglycan-binding domain